MDAEVIVITMDTATGMTQDTLVATENALMEDGVEMTAAGTWVDIPFYTK